MAIAQRQRGPQQGLAALQASGRGGPSGLADVLEVLLDKGLVIDAFVRVSLVGIELLTVDARVVVASVDTYLRFAEAVNRLDLLQAHNSQTLGEILGGGSPRREAGTSRALSSSSRRGDPGDDVSSDGGSEGTDQEQPQASAGKETQGSGPPAGDASGDDDKGLLSRIKERGQVF